MNIYSKRELFFRFLAQSCIQRPPDATDFDAYRFTKKSEVRRSPEPNYSNVAASILPSINDMKVKVS